MYNNYLRVRPRYRIFDEPNDYLVIETLLELVQIYGLGNVKKAVDVPAEYKADNSMKHIRYVIGILQKSE